MNEKWQKLQEPFPAVEVEWRIQKAGDSGSGPWGRAVPYISYGAIIRRLDKVIGPEDWRDEYKTWHSIEEKDKDGRGGKGTGYIIPSQLCGLSIRHTVNDWSEWITKWDGAECTDIQPVKGGLTDSFKRAAVKWGIGLYLRSLDEEFVQIVPQGTQGAFYNRSYDRNNNVIEFHWLPPQLPDWALPKSDKNYVGSSSVTGIAAVSGGGGGGAVIDAHEPAYVPVAPAAVQHSAVMGEIDQQMIDQATMISESMTTSSQMEMTGKAFTADVNSGRMAKVNEGTINLMRKIYQNRYLQLKAAENKG